MIKYFLDFIKQIKPSKKVNVEMNEHYNEIIKFKKKAMESILTHLYNTEYSKHTILMKEIRFLMHYTLEVLQDDFFKGDKILQKNMTKIDDYLFSQYRKDSALEFNIKKLLILAKTNRFDENLKKNLLNYFVFIEETGFELIVLLDDFYYILDEKNKNHKFFVKSKLEIGQKYLKKYLYNNRNKEQNKSYTLVTQNITQKISNQK